MKLPTKLEAFIGGQYACPHGIIGQMIGEKMVRQHVSETDWTVSLLNLQPTDSVLEIGFGAGRALEIAATRVPRGHVTGIDLSPTMLQSASRRNRQAINEGRVDLHLGNINELPFADTQFDKIMSIQTFYFWPGIPQAIAELLRVLKPGGLLVLTLSTGRIDQPGTPGLDTYQTVLEEQVIPEMGRAGFTEAHIEQGPASRQFKTTAVIGVK